VLEVLDLVRVALTGCPALAQPVGVLEVFVLAVVDLFADP